MTWTTSDSGDEPFAMNTFSAKFDGGRKAGVTVPDEKADTDVKRIQTITIAAAIIFACRGKESMDEALDAANDIFDRVTLSQGAKIAE
jgi:hypothetical protein